MSCHIWLPIIEKSILNKGFMVFEGISKVRLILRPNKRYLNNHEQYLLEFPFQITKIQNNPLNRII